MEIEWNLSNPTPVKPELSRSDSSLIRKSVGLGRFPIYSIRRLKYWDKLKLVPQVAHDRDTMLLH